MQLKITTDYAIRILLCLYANEGMVPSPTIEKEMGIPPNYVLKISRQLVKANLVKPISGKGGGLQICKSASDVTLWDVVSAIENTTKLNRCLEADRYCSRNAVDTCPVRKYYCTVQETYENSLKGVTMKQLLDGEWN